MNVIEINVYAIENDFRQTYLCYSILKNKLWNLIGNNNYFTVIKVNSGNVN